ncbi:DUF2510 domain-containing protein [Streptomyces resistomycificus]|uniref:Membrane protein n=1 Tax=Streptomyces resistomycificus TaxID=67356 RepID=A0A0L8LV02_9ACTN|nr:DUF2510 domain-containing protein [Streptomyces resistomycificus]KOG42017.1 membrane protein [Streptomyces resistomycificus]KUN94783.1 hypothetical protein AQJ84_25805 [Streptomyces resistomycificus]
MTPSPGWYPDPSAPHLERWWDGAVWTEHRRVPEAVETPTPPAPSEPGGAASGRAKAVALTTAAVVLVAAIVTGVAVLGEDDDSGPVADALPTAVTSPPVTPTTGPPTSSAPPGDPDVVVDQLNGITLPLPDGWTRPENVAEDDVVMTTDDGTYDCPAGIGTCRHGLVLTHTVTENDERSPRALAEQDIADAADAAYEHDTLDRRVHGGIESHRTVRSGQVAVAGRAGYLVRWRVRTAEGPGGYVQSLAFSSSVGSESPVIVRFVFDAGPDGPPLADMDRITKGIRPVGDADTGGGVGSSIGPTG